MNIMNILNIMNISDIITLALAIRSCIAKNTDIIPDIEFEKNCKNFLVVFRGNIPDEETIIKIKNDLNVFGSVIPNDYRKQSIVSFKISY